jgi:A/G-specific adenine glycosylase
VADAIEFPPDARDAILAWYALSGRRLPFRGTTDPYAILVSEAMAQQTQVARVGEAWTRFMARFPTVESLAGATPADVLRAWQGLGYNRRALALWRAARQIVDEHGGQVPSDLAELEALPGVGPYTARAVAAIAFGMPVGAVDTNVRRVLGRVAVGDTRSLPAAHLQRVADATVPPDAPAAWTHAVMDLGATVCRPARPACAGCPARPWCRFARAESRVESRPRSPMAPKPFPTTSRWLRGRILDRLRAAPDGAWVELDGAIGTHDAAAVMRAGQALASEGLLELADDGQDQLRARLPVA